MGWRQSGTPPRRIFRRTSNTVDEISPALAELSEPPRETFAGEALGQGEAQITMAT
jgi:hypothetical protein